MKQHDTHQQSWINQEQLDTAVAFAEEEGLFQRLNALYETIPEGECGGCAACCMESVETHWVEFLQIYAYLRERTELLHQLTPTILRFYLLEGAEKRHCPFQMEGRRCAIYPVRPLPCRLFGQWGEADYEANYEVTLRGNRGMAEYYRTEYGLILPDVVVTHKVPYCQRFHRPEVLTQEGFYDLLDGIMGIQSRFLFAGLADEDTTALGLVAWWTGLWFDLEGLQEEKVAVMREYLEGERTERLEGFLHRT
jgi:Fe-S-cluster containining protein